MTKIAHLTSVHLPFDVRIFQKECKSLIQAGYDLVLIAPHTKDEIVEGVPVRMVKRPKNKVLRILTGSWRVYQAIRQDDRDIYHFHDTELIPLGLLLRWAGKQVIYDMHENVPGALSTKEWIPVYLRQPLSQAFKTFERLVLNNFFIIFAEKSYAAEYTWLKRTSIVLNYPLADQLLLVNAEKCIEPTIGYVGDVREDRGAGVTIEALTLLQQRGKSPHWLCVGRITDKLRESLQKVVDTEGLSVDFRGYVVSTEAHPLVARAHIGLAVVARTPNNVGSLLTKLFEYMALGMPIITSDFPLYKELIEGIGCGLCVAPESPQQLADAIDYLLSHPQEAAGMGERGREAVRANYNWRSEAEKLIEVYESLLNNDR